MTSITAIFFDLDGTLVDSSIGIHNAFTYTFKELGVPSPDAKTIRGFMGPPLESSFATCLSKDQILKPCRYIVLTIRQKASMKLNSFLRL
ncbi:phosphatase [Streptococcus pneumoniae]|nr:phosphatase [Streptococcus pneumoniae]